MDWSALARTIRLHNNASFCFRFNYASSAKFRTLSMLRSFKNLSIECKVFVLVLGLRLTMVVVLQLEYCYCYWVVLILILQLAMPAYLCPAAPSSKDLTTRLIDRVVPFLAVILLSIFDFVQ
jgi:hypothetical protein